MSALNRSTTREQIMSLLWESHQPERAATPAGLEANLRWLAQLALPEIPAPRTLRRRIRTLAYTIAARWRDGLLGPSRPLAWSLGCREEQHGQEQSRPEPPAPLTAEDRELLTLLFTIDFQQLPEEPVLRAEAHRVMRQLLNSLPEQQREALLLQVTQNLQVAEIARVLGCPVAEVHEALYEARAAIFRLVAHQPID